MEKAPLVPFNQKVFLLGCAQQTQRAIRINASRRTVKRAANSSGKSSALKNSWARSKRRHTQLSYPMPLQMENSLPSSLESLRARSLSTQSGAMGTLRMKRALSKIYLLSKRKTYRSKTDVQVYCQGLTPETAHQTPLYSISRGRTRHKAKSASSASR